MKTSPIESVIVDMILTHYNIQSFTGKSQVLSGEEFDRLVKEAEQEYYKKIFQGDNYKMLKKNHFIDSYNISSKFDYFVSHNSTLGYELLSRNYRVAIIRKEINYTSKNKNNLPVIDSLTSYRPKGYIWTDSCEKRETFRVLNNIIGISKTRNKHFINKYVNPIMMHDFQCENNFKFLKSIGFKVKKNVYSK